MFSTSVFSNNWASANLPKFVSKSLNLPKPLTFAFLSCLRLQLFARIPVKSVQKTVKYNLNIAELSPKFLSCCIRNTDSAGNPVKASDLKKKILMPKTYKFFKKTTDLYLLNYVPERVPNCYINFVYKYFIANRISVSNAAMQNCLSFLKFFL